VQNTAKALKGNYWSFARSVVCAHFWHGFRPGIMLWH